MISPTASTFPSASTVSTIMPLRLTFLAAALWSFGLTAHAADPVPETKAQDKPEKPSEKPAEKKSETPDNSVTKHSLALRDGSKLDYTATAGLLPLTDDEGKPKAGLFHMAYTKGHGPADPKRPVTFCFNGGPGSASVWLHLGVLGPKRVVLNADGSVPPPPGSLADNPHTLLEVSDLVFLDPISTGFSKAAPKESPAPYHGFRGDLDSVGEAIRLYLTREGRWSSQKYLAGESYGTTRAAGLSGHLQRRLGIELNGIVLVSTVLQFNTISFTDDNDTPYVSFLPTYTACAWHFKKLAPDLQADLNKALAEAESFAVKEYLPALAQLGTLPEARKNELAAKMARLTGLSEAYVKGSGLRVEPTRFRRELLRDKPLSLGRFDGRALGPEDDLVGESASGDASLTNYMGLFTATMHDYLRHGLEWKKDQQYQVLAGLGWDYSPFENRFVDTAATLREAMTKNPSLRVFIGSGYYDLATPYFGAENTFSRMDLPAGGRQRLTFKRYHGGHMYYFGDEELKSFAADLRAFYAPAK